MCVSCVRSHLSPRRHSPWYQKKHVCLGGPGGGEWNTKSCIEGSGEWGRWVGKLWIGESEGVVGGEEGVTGEGVARRMMSGDL